MHLRGAKKEIIERYQRRGKKLHNRIRMLKREKHRAYSKEKKMSFDKKILETEQKSLIIKEEKDGRVKNNV